MRYIKGIGFMCDGCLDPDNPYLNILKNNLSVPVDENFLVNFRKEWDLPTDWTPCCIDCAREY